MVTIVIFQAFNREHREVFVKGESFKDINEKLSGICSSYEPMSILQGEMTDMPLFKLNDEKVDTNKFKPNQIEKEILIEALNEYKNKNAIVREIVTVGTDNCSELLKSFEKKNAIASELQDKLNKG